MLSGEPQALPAVLDAQACVHGGHWRWDGVSFRTWRWSGAGDSNQASCLLLVEAGGERLLLTGDIDVRTERALLAEGLPLRADWLLAPHHGSRSSSSAALLDAVAPQAVLISRGRHNPFGHPHAEVLARYRQRGIRVHDTALHGALQLQLGAFTEPRRLREARVFWREK